MPDKNVRVRFAPSPTGNPHVGNFRTALYNYLFARNQKGSFLLRIEDTDPERSKTEYVNAIRESMEWLGMHPDEEPIFQSARIQRHQDVANQLIEEGKAYRDRMTPEELETLRQEQTAAGKKPMYNRRDREMNYPDDGTPFCIRLKTPLEGTTSLHDPLRGEIVVDNSEIDDLVIVRRDGSPTYNFAVVIDDIDMEITHVIRGDDHTNNSIRQVVIYQLLGYELPNFIHLPQILGPDKTRLSKRHGATGVLEYKEQGYLPEGLLNYLARLGWGHGDQEIFTPEELIDYFSFDHLNKSSAVFDAQKFLWVNAEHIRRKTAEELSELFITYTIEQGLLSETFTRNPDNRQLFIQIAEITRERAHTLWEMHEIVSFLFNDHVNYDEGEPEKVFTEDAVKGLEEFCSTLERHDESEPQNFTKENWEKLFKDILEKLDMKMKILAMATRIALTGTRKSPPIFDVMELLGKDQVCQRLKQAIEFYKNSLI